MALAPSWSKHGVRQVKVAASLASSLLVVALLVFWNTRPNSSGQLSLANPSQPVPDLLPVSAAEVGRSNRTTFKRILLWTKFVGYNDFYKGMGHAPFVDNGCSVSDCVITTNRSLLRSSDAVVFHFVMASIHDLPKWRRPNQRWIFFLGESPAHHSSKKLEAFNGLFNWTMTYRLDSDVVNTYGFTSKMSAISRRPKKVTKKRHLALWLVSHCRTKGRREQYVEELRRHVPIDVYGACAENQTHRTCPEESCGFALYRSHKFYLSFENSVCRDYVTEKFFKALRHHVVPVVFGGADYARVAPPGSYVDVRDFDSPRHLAEHLKMLDANDTLYEEYLQWTSKWRVSRNWGREHGFCQLCAALHDPVAKTDAYNKVYDDIATWWAGPGICSKIRTIKD